MSTADAAEGEGAVVVHAATPADLVGLARRIGARLAAGDRILLSGDLGAGKTTFVRGCVEGLGHPDSREVVSPTFAIHNHYVGGRLPVDHIDLYRIQFPVLLAKEGLELVVADRSGVLFCEWPERLCHPLDDVSLKVRIDFDRASGRVVTLAASPSSSARLLGGVAT